MHFTKNLQRFRLITFDITDTLLKFKEDPIRIYADTAALKFGLQNISEDKLRKCFRQEFKAMSKEHSNFGCKTFGWRNWWINLVKRTFHCANSNVDEETLDKLAVYLVKIFRTKECWQRIDCGDALVQKVRNLGICIGCISNFDPSLEDVLKEMNLNFDFILTSYDAGIMKPQREIFNLALETIENVKPNEALHIGNSFDLDFKGAKNAGWSSLLVSQESFDNKDIKKDLIYESMCDMLKALETKNIEW